MWNLEKISVESYSGYKLHESPRAFIFRGRRYIIREIIDRWYEGSVSSDDPVIDYFKVRTDDGMEYVIRYNSYQDEWDIVVRFLSG